jgi:hypothetical protein
MSVAGWDPTRLHFEFPLVDRELRFKELILYVSHVCLDDPTYSRTKLLKILPRRRNLWAKASVSDGCRRGTSGAFCRWNQLGRMPRSSLAVSAARRVRMSVM